MSDQETRPQDPDALRRDIEQTRADLGDTVEALAHKADVKSQVSEKVEERKAAMRERGERLKAKAGDRGGQLKAKLGDRGEQLKTKVGETRERVANATPEDAKRAATEVAHTAEKKPFPAIGIALGFGLLLGWLLGRR